MTANRASAEFDEISAVYDATRDPLSTTSVEAIVATLRLWGIRRLVEVGVGTGRVAAPLLERGLEVTGIDAAPGMLARARAKGIHRLVQGNAYRLPFGDQAFDAALFVHVLHILDDPVVALTEACRVSRVGAAGLVRPPTGEEGAERFPRPRRILMDLLREDGVDLPARAHEGPRTERRLITEHPPDRLVTVTDEWVTEPLVDDLRMFEQRASRWTLNVPPEKLARAIAKARLQVGDGTRTYRRVLALALWEHPPSIPAARSEGPRNGNGPAQVRPDPKEVPFRRSAG